MELQIQKALSAGVVDGLHRRESHARLWVLECETHTVGESSRLLELVRMVLEDSDRLHLAIEPRGLI